MDYVDKLHKQKWPSIEPPNGPFITPPLTVQALEEGDGQGQAADGRGVGVAGGDQETGLLAVADLPGHRVQQQQWPAGDRFPVVLGVEKPGAERPPVVDQRHHPRDQPAAGQVMGREAAPTPVVLRVRTRADHGGKTR